MQLQLTNAGINALLRAISGDDLTLTCVKIGNGAAQSPAAATDLSNPLVTLSISECTVANSKATIAVTLQNSSIEAGFRLTEIGVFAQDQDDSNEEILYAYGTEPEATADYVAASGDNILEEDITIDVFVGNAENVSAIINDSLVYATKADFDAHVANKANPHEVTKAQVGLGNVPNVATNDQTPTYTEASEDANLTSGERLAVAFGKISRAVRSMISHLTATGNVHDATPAQIGAAAASHEHTASDVTSGILSVRRGGTGIGTWVTNRLLYPSASAAFSQLPFPSKNGMFLSQNTSGAPFWALAGADRGTYIGHGRTGSNHPSFTFNANPKVVIIQEEGSGLRWGMLFPASTYGFSYYDGTFSELRVGGNDGTLISWWQTAQSSSPTYQLDVNNKTYHYVAFY